MEEYINLDTIVKDGFFDLFKEEVICPLCFNILIEPIICIKCEKVYCKKCIKKWNKKNVRCPNNCNAPTYQDFSGKNEILTNLRFKCVWCSYPINYYDASKHHDIFCSKKLSSEEGREEKKNNEEILRNLKRISNLEFEKLKKIGNKVQIISSKFTFFI